MYLSKKINLILALFLAVAFISSCNKAKVCDQSEICLINNNTDYVFIYEFNGSSNTDTLFEGERTCLQIDPIEVKGISGEPTDDVSSIDIIAYDDYDTYYLAVDPTGCSTDYEVESQYCYYTKSNCSNDELDDEEYDIDCGGPFCDPCNPVVYSCSISQNKISGLGSGASATVSNVSASLNSIYFDAGINHFEFELNSGIISSARRHYFIGYTEVGTFTAKLSQGFFYTYQASADQDIYIEEIGPNTYELKFCDLKFSYSIDQVYVSGTIKFSL